ncbi:MAG: glycosyltransferase family 39 protein [Deltaproteobacteria bacterium]|nr:glycosyltransferase family 39 protein [Deltaproteobacteria bacterium]
MKRLLEEERYHLPFLFVFSLLLYITFLGSRDLWAPVEPRYGEIARVMFSRGEWLVPTVNGELYTDKPILFFWLVLAFSHLFGGINEWTLRLPSALASVGLVIVTYRLGRDFFDHRVGLLAALVLATSFRVWWEARWAHTDMLFTFFFTTATYFLLRAWHDRGRETTLAYGLMGLATLTKGLIGFVLPGLIFLCLLLVRGNSQRFRRLKLWQGLGIFLLVAAPWFVAVGLQTEGQWISEFFWTHHVQRYLSGLGHKRPFYYYLINFPADFLPWTPFLVLAAFVTWQVRKIPLRPASFSLATWFFVIFAFFSLSDTKRGLYLLPLYPPAAIWVAHALIEFEKGERRRPRVLTVISGLCFGMLGLTALSLPIVVNWIRPEILLGSAALALVIVVGSLFAHRAFKTNLLSSGSLWLVAIVFSGVLSNGLWVFPVINQYKSPRIFAIEVKKKVSQDAPLYIYADRMNDFNFYLERKVIPVLSKPEDLARLGKHDELVYLLIRDRDLDRAQGEVRSLWKRIINGSTGRKKWNLMRSRGAPQATEETSRRL